MQITLKPVPHEDGMEVLRLRWEEGVLMLNGKGTKAVDGMVIPYSEQLGCSTFSDDDGAQILVIPSTWVNPAPQDAVPEAEENLTEPPAAPAPEMTPEPAIEA